MSDFSFVLGATCSALNYWYIQDVSNGTEANWDKRSLSSKAFTKTSNLVERAVEPLLKRYVFPEGEIQTLIVAFKTYFNLTIEQITYGYIPNPFKGLASTSAVVSAERDLTVVDQAETGQALPFWGQIQPSRASDFIVAWDDGEDDQPYSWQRGTTVYNSYVDAAASGIPFPIVPPPNTMQNLNYTIKPVLFGCDPKLTTTGDVRSPIVLYYANAPYSMYSNYSYLLGNYSDYQINEILVNSFNEVTQGNGTLATGWPVCIGCAAIDRSLAKVGMTRTKQCQSCFDEYCWDGTLDESTPPVLDPSAQLLPGVGYVEWNLTHPF